MKQIYAIPGLGTTAALYNFIRVRNAEVKVLQWPGYNKNETLQSYAAKLAEQIDDSKPFYLMGVSYGGMLCCEISLIKKPVKTILISSCEDPSEFPWTLKTFKYFPLYKMVSDNMFRSMAKGAKLVLGFKNEYKSEFHKMVTEMPQGYFKNSICSLIQWKSCCNKQNIVRIHGDNDRLIWFSGVRKKVDYRIEGGTHSMILDRAHEINRILDRITQ